jgi:hypothetical protein
VARYPSAGARSIGVFYDNYERAKEAERAKSLLLRQGDVAAAKGVNVPVTLDRIADALGDQRRLIQAIYVNPNMSPDEKRALVDRVYFSMIALARKANEVTERSNDRRSTQPAAADIDDWIVPTQAAGN